jgi:hypothetical protein
MRQVNCRSIAPSPACGGGLGWGCLSSTRTVEFAETFPHPRALARNCAAERATSPASGRGAAEDVENAYWHGKPIGPGDKIL